MSVAHVRAVVCVLVVVLAGALAGSATPARSSYRAVNLIRNGSFELPGVGTGYTLFTPGQQFAGWTVVGPDQSNVAVISGSFAQNGFSFPAAAGKQAMDLTGTSDLVNRNLAGVSQVVKTARGASYTLRFSVSNVVNPGGVFGTSSTVEVQVNGQRALLAKNALGKGSATQVWKAFSLRIKASSTSTKIAFLNYDPASDTANGLDAVSLTRG
jgi:hypothetical protein